MTQLLQADGTPAPATTVVAIAIPSGDQVAAGFAFDLTRLVAFTTAKKDNVKVLLFNMKSTLIPEARNGLVHEARAAGATHILWLDSDMRFPPDTLYRLLESGKDVIGANYSTRRFPYQPTAEIYGQGLVYLSPEATGELEVSRMGMGVMLTTMRVFDALTMPYFALPWNDKAQCFMGEDIYFCRAAAKAGFPVMCDMGLSVLVKHCGEMEYANDHMLAMMEHERANEQASEKRDGPDVV